MKRIKLEIWKSSQNQEERHYFIVKKGKGYQQHQYVFGYNPEVIDTKTVIKVIKIIQEHL